MHYLYRITCIVNNKVYIGQTKDKARRWKQHQYYAKHAEHPAAQYIHRAMAKHGVENFTFEIIDVALNQWQADCMEMCLIQYYDSRNHDVGYNLARGGVHADRSPEGLALFIEKTAGNKHWSRQPKHQEAWERFLSSPHKPWNTGMTGEGQPMFGKHQSDYQKAVMSQWNKEHPKSEETKHKISATLKEKGIKPTQRWSKGRTKPHTEEAKQKMSQSRKGRIPWNKGDNRRAEVQQLFKQGMRKTDIATTLNISPSTVTKYTKIT